MRPGELSRNIEGVTLNLRQTATVVDSIKNNSFTVFFLGVCCLGYIFDSYDTAMISYLLPSIKAEWALTPVQMGWIASSAMWGTFLGQYLWGPIGDVFGRKFAFQGTILSFSILTGVAALSPNIGILILLRFVAGMGMGGFIPLDAVMVTEMTPTRSRGRMVGVVPVLFPLGQLLAVAATFGFIGSIGWRGMFVVGAIPALIAFIARTKIPESPRWLVQKQRYREANAALKRLGATDEDILKAAETTAEDDMTQEEIDAQNKNRYKELFSKKYATRNILTWGIWTTYLFGYFGFVLWMPSIFITKFGFTLSKSLSYLIVIAAAGVVGRFVAIWLIEVIGRKTWLSILFLIMTVLALIFGRISDPIMLLVMACIWTFFAEQVAEFIVVYVPELYPTHLRAAGAAFAIAPGRCAAAISSIVIGALMTADQYYSIWLLFAGLFFIGAIITMVFGIETKGKQLEQISG